MLLFLTGVLPFLAHDHASAAAFLTCRHHNFHASIIPEFLSDEERVKSFCEARKRSQLKVRLREQYSTLYNLFVQTPLMQFSPSLIVWHEDCAESILEPLLETKYFTRSLRRCCLGVNVVLSNHLLQALSKVQSLIKLDLGFREVENEHMEIIVNSFPSLETLTIQNAGQLKTVDATGPATKTLRNLTLGTVSAMFSTQFIPNFPNLRKLVLSGTFGPPQELDLRPLSSSLPHLNDISFERFAIKSTDSLKHLVHLSSIELKWSQISDLSFLSEENSLPRLTALSIRFCKGLSTSSFTSLSHAANLRVLEVVESVFNDDCLRYLQNMVHLRKLDLSHTKIVGDSESFKIMMQNLFQLEELDLVKCRIGGQGAIAGALYSTHSRLRVLNLCACDLVDDDLNGIGALKNTLETLYLQSNGKLTNEALTHCKDLVKLKRLALESCVGITDLSPLNDCLNLIDLDLSRCDGLTHDSFRVFSDEPNSFPNLRTLDLSYSS